MRTISNNLTLCLKELEKEGQIKAKVSRRKEIIRMRAEINGNRNRKIIGSMKLRAVSLKR